MPDAPLPEAALAFLRRPNPAVMATVTATGRPVSVATWYLIEDDGLLMLCMNADRARLKHLRDHGHVSLTALAADDFGTVFFGRTLIFLPFTMPTETSILCMVPLA